MIWTRSPRCSRRLAMAVTDRGATTSWPSVAPREGGDKSWVLAMLAAKRRLRVAPVPPQAAADLTPPARVARTMPGRDEGTGALIEPRNNHAQASRLAVNTTRVLQSFAQWWVRLNCASHTEIRILPRRCPAPCAPRIAPDPSPSCEGARPNSAKPQAAADVTADLTAQPAEAQRTLENQRFPAHSRRQGIAGRIVLDLPSLSKGECLGHDYP